MVRLIAKLVYSQMQTMQTMKAMQTMKGMNKWHFLLFE
jgi:hypothetical protein